MSRSFVLIKRENVNTANSIYKAIQATVRMYMPGKLIKYAVSEGTKAVSKVLIKNYYISKRIFSTKYVKFLFAFSNNSFSENEKQNFGSGLVIQVNVVRYIIKKLYPNVCITPFTVIYLTAGKSVYYTFIINIFKY